MNRPRALGTWAETAVVRYLRTRGWAQAERRALAGARDRGDVAGVLATVIGVKNEKRIALGEYVDAVRVQQANDGARYGVMWVRRRGTTDPGRWYVVMDGETFTVLLADAHDLTIPERP